MEIFCTSRVKKDIEKLEKNNSYSNLRRLLHDYISGKKTAQNWMEGSRIHFGNPNFICVKKRLGGSGGYRMWYLLTISGEEVTIAALYPKFGSEGASDLSDKGRIDCMGEAIDQISEKSRWQILLRADRKSVDFQEEKIKKAKVQTIG